MPGIKSTTIILATAICLASPASLAKPPKTPTAAAAKTYRYRCPKCGLIQEYKNPGSKKCPNDKRTMIRTN